MTEVDIENALKMFDEVKIDTAKATVQIEARLALKGERFMKGQSPVLTGTLRRSLYAAPTMKPWGIATTINYAKMANLRSRRPHFIEKTAYYIGSIAKVEAQHIINRMIS